MPSLGYPKYPATQNGSLHDADYWVGCIKAIGQEDGADMDDGDKVSHPYILVFHHSLVRFKLHRFG